MSANAKKGLVSVIVASYNHAGYLKRRMESLLQQTYPLLEVIVIDDHSTDDSVKVLEQYAEISNVQIIRHSYNQGWVKVSNEGLRSAAGMFILFANCDDFCDPSMISRLASTFYKHPNAGMAFCRSHLVDKDGAVIGDDYVIRAPEFVRRCVGDTLITGDEMTRFLMHSCVAPNLSAVLFRRECLEALGGFSGDYKVCADWDLFFRLSERFDVAYVSAALNDFRQHENSIRSRTRERIIYAEYIRLLCKRVRNEQWSGIERMCFRARVISLWTIHITNRPRDGIRDFPYHSMIVMRYDPLAILFLPGVLAARTIKIAVKRLTREWTSLQ